MTTYDVAVVGLGGFGSAAAYHLAGRGLRVVGFDRYPPGHLHGSSHGESRIVRQAYFEGADYVPLLRRAYELWDRLAVDSGGPLLIRTGGVFAGTPDSEVVSGSLASARQWGIPHDVLDGAELARRFPDFAPVAGLVAVFELEAGVVSPDDAVAAHLRLAAAAGAELRHEEPVVGWQPEGHGVRVTTLSGSISAGWLVLAPGRWAGELLGDMAPPLRVERREVHWFDPPGRGEVPAWIWERDGVIPYGAPDRGRGLKVSVHHSSPRAADSWSADEVAEVVAPLLPGLGGHHRASQECWYELTPDRHFVVGAMPGTDRVLVACGFSGHGFKFTPVIGAALADLVSEGRTSIPLAMFAPARFAA